MTTPAEPTTGAIPASAEAVVPARGRRTAALVALLATAWLLVALVAPFGGARWLDPAAVWAGEATTATIFWQIRLPRVLVALFAGSILALGGTTFQTLFRNPLAEPYTLGVAGGAALGAVLALRLGGEQAGLVWVAGAAFLGALVASALVLALGGTAAGGGGAGTLLLAGVAVSFSCSAAILFLQYVSDANQTFRIVRWMLGGLGVVGYREVLWLLPAALLLALALRRRRWELNLLLLGEELAASRGLELAALRRELVLVVSLAVGALVAVAGPLGFVGLVVPHLVRRLVGSDHLGVVPACFFAGGAFLALCDLAGRSLLAPVELPVGILTAMIGGPFFLWLVLSRRRVN
jgi:iron complex transport system permease protein